MQGETTGLTYPHLLAKWKEKRNEQGMLAQKFSCILFFHSGKYGRAYAMKANVRL